MSGQNLSLEAAIALATVQCDSEYGVVSHVVGTLATDGDYERAYAPKKGHTVESDGSCSCGRITTAHASYVWPNISGVCFEQAEWVITLAYERDEPGHGWVTYGVQSNGSVDCWAS